MPLISRGQKRAVVTLVYAFTTNSTGRSRQSLHARAVADREDRGDAALSPIPHWLSVFRTTKTASPDNLAPAIMDLDERTGIRSFAGI